MNLETLREPTAVIEQDVLLFLNALAFCNFCWHGESLQSTKAVLQEGAEVSQMQRVDKHGSTTAFWHKITGVLLLHAQFTKVITQQLISCLRGKDYGALFPSFIL